MQSVNIISMSASDITDRKREANQQNAQRSTGPRTPEGKSASSQNATKYGLFAADHVILPSESNEDHAALEEDFIQSIRPTDAIERAIVERMINARWKLRRLRDAEAINFEKRAGYEADHQADEAVRTLDTKGMKQREVQERIKQIRANVKWEEVTPGRLIATVYHYEEELAKQEQRLENAFYKATRELRTWRAEKRANAKAAAHDSDTAVACGFGDQAQREVEGMDAATNESSISQNEPTVSASPDEIKACEVTEETSHSTQTQEVSNQLPANIVHPIQLNLPESG